MQERHYNQQPSRRRMGDARNAAASGSSAAPRRAANPQRRSLTPEERQAIAERRARRGTEGARREGAPAMSGQTRARQRVAYDAADRQRIDYGATRVDRAATASPERIERERSENAAVAPRRRAAADRQTAESGRPLRQRSAERPSARPQRMHPDKRAGLQADNPRATRPPRASRRNAPSVETQPQGVQLSADQQASVDMFHNGAIMAFTVILVLGALIGLLFFARPSASAFEKRNLTEFPKPTLTTFRNGEFFSDVSLWYSDTYPLREILVKANQGIKSHYGLHSDTMMVGGNVQADELPAATDSKKKKKKHTKVEAPNEEAMAADIQDQIMSGLYIQDGAAYGIYYFVQDAVDLYAEALSMAGDELEGEANVYSLLVPNNSIILDEDTLAGLGGTDQAKALEYFDGMYSENVTSVFFLDQLREHRDEYLFFRTDHHWTQLGAFYAYKQYCKEKGFDPIPLEDRESETYDGFLGTYYTELGLPEMENNPDQVVAHRPIGTNDMTIYDQDGSETAANVIQDVSGWERSSYYSTFIGADHSLEIVENPKIDDGSSCLLVKDSYGCAFAPLLVDHYQTLYIIDFRYSDRNIVDFVREKGIDDVVFINNMSLATTSTVGNALYSEIDGCKSKKAGDSD